MLNDRIAPKTARRSTGRLPTPTATLAKIEQACFEAWEDYFEAEQQYAAAKTEQAKTAALRESVRRHDRGRKLLAMLQRRRQHELIEPV